MLSRKRVLAGFSAVALAAGTTLTGAGLASAQDDAEESTGSLSSSSLNLGETAADLALAAEALNGPVTVTSNPEGGPTVTYTNEGDGLEHCVGFTMPYSAVDETGLDPSGAENPMDLLGPILEIQAMGGVSMLMPGGETYEATEDEGIAQAALRLIGLKMGTPVEPEQTVSWDAATPEEPAAAAFLCIPDVAEDRIAAIETAFGIDKQVVADQINGKIPGGSVEPVTAGSISGGSVEMGATALGSLAGGDEEEPPVEEEPAPTAE